MKDKFFLDIEEGKVVIGINGNNIKVSPTTAVELATHILKIARLA